MRMHTIETLLSSIPKEKMRDAQFLLADILNKPTSYLLTQASTMLLHAQVTQFELGFSKLQQGKPLAYVVGNQPFWSLNFLVNEHTLIPRPDTEHLVEQALNLGDELAQNKQSNVEVLDLGTGSGVIAICLKHERPNWQVTATDYSAEALTVAKENSSRNNTNVTFLQGSWFDVLDENKQFDMIVSNPPYIAPNDEHLADLTDEPITALVAENNGMADIENIVSGAKQHLQDNAWLLIEHGYNQGQLVRDCFLEHGFNDVSTVNDFGGNERLTKGRYCQ